MVAEHATSKLAAGYGSAPRRILLVDDNRDAADSLAMLLQSDGHDTHVAYDGATALERVESLQPEVILLDIGLPALNGYEVCQQIRARSSSRQAVVIAITGWGQESDRRKSRDAGFDAHLVKPVAYSELVTLVGQIAHRRSLH